MDRVIEKRKWPARKIGLIAAAIASVTALAALVIGSPGNATLRVDTNRVTIARVDEGAFLEYIPIIGSVEPITTVYLDAVEGGRVEEILVDDGGPIEAGALILRLSNSSLQKEAISTESVLLENINTLRNTRINLAEKELVLKELLLDTSYRILQLEKQHERYQAILTEGGQALSKSEFEAVADELDYQRARREIIKARIEQEKTLRVQQLAQVDATITRVQRNLEIISDTLDNLDVRAPISGHLSTLKVEIGQNVMRGQNIGQIDVLDAFKVTARVDQYYISKVSIGQRGTFEFGNQRFPLEIVKVYSEVTDDQFEVDMAFIDAVPSGIKRGQSLRIDLSLSGVGQGLLLPRGGFHRSTGGRWIFQITDDGTTAYRRDIALGRQNPKFFEVLSGLQPGDRVITSSYDSFGTAETIEFDPPLAPVPGTGS